MVLAGNCMNCWGTVELPWWVNIGIGLGIAAVVLAVTLPLVRWWWYR